MVMAWIWQQAVDALAHAAPTGHDWPSGGDGSAALGTGSTSIGGWAGLSRCSGTPHFLRSRSNSAISASVKWPKAMLVLEMFTFDGGGPSCWCVCSTCFGAGWNHG